MSTTVENTFIKTCSYTCQREILEGTLLFFQFTGDKSFTKKKLQTMNPFSAVSN